MGQYCLRPLLFQALLFKGAYSVSAGFLEFFLGFCHKSNQLKLLIFLCKRGDRYAIVACRGRIGGINCTWRRLGEIPGNIDRYRWWINLPCEWNGMINWINQRDVIIIYSFDIEDELFQLVPPPFIYGTGWGWINLPWITWGLPLYIQRAHKNQLGGVGDEWVCMVTRNLGLRSLFFIIISLILSLLVIV